MLDNKRMNTKSGLRAGFSACMSTVPTRLSCTLSRFVDVVAMLKRLAQMLLGLPDSGDKSCASCKRKHSVAKPFIEGITGVLVCHTCVIQISTQQRSAETQSPVVDTISDSKNPYQTPNSSAIQALCEFCGGKTNRLKTFGGGKPHRICYDCIRDSVILIESQS